MPGVADGPKLLQRYMGGLVHVHTRASNFPTHTESNLTRRWLISKLQNNGLIGENKLEYIIFTEHVSNPARPAKLGWHGRRLAILLAVRRLPRIRGVRVLYGHEVSILVNGSVDLPDRLAHKGSLVIASRHWVPPELEYDAESIEQMCISACNNPRVNILGHSMRFIEGVGEVNWTRIFEAAAQTATAVELNFNIFPDPKAEPVRYEFWRGWLATLAKSQAYVTIGVDLHTKEQVMHFIHYWQAAKLGQPSPLTNFLSMIAESGITDQRVVSSTWEDMTAWIGIDKTVPARVSSV